MTIFQQTGAVSSCTDSAFCSGNGLNGEYQDFHASEGGTSSATATSLTIDASANNLIAIFWNIVDGTNNLEDLDGATGNWIFELNVTTGNHQISWTGVDCCRILGTGACTNQETILSDNTFSDNLSATGVRSQTINQASAITMGASDEVAVLYAFDNANSMGQAIGFDKTEQITNQWAAAAGASTTEVSDPQGIIISPQGPTVQTGKRVDVSTPQVLTLTPQGPNIETGASVLVSGPQPITIQPHGPTVQSGATISVGDSQALVIQPQGPVIQSGATVFVGAPQGIIVQPQDPTIAFSGPIVSVSSPAALLLLALDPTILSGVTLNVSNAQDIVIQPQGPTVRSGASVFASPASLLIQAPSPTVQSGATVFVDDPLGLLLSPQGPAVQSGVSVDVSDAGVITLTIPGPTIQASSLIGAEVKAPVTLTLMPLGPTIDTGAAQVASRYSVHRGRGVWHSRGVRDYLFDVGGEQVSIDSEDIE